MPARLERFSCRPRVPIKKAFSPRGNGNYSYIDSAAEARKVLVDEGGSTLVTIAKDVKVQLAFNSEVVESYRLIGYENRMLQKQDFANDKVDAGELGPGHSVTALYELALKPRMSSQNLVDVRLRYKLPNEKESKQLSHTVSITKQEGSEEMRFATAVAAFGLLLKDSAHKGTLTWSQLQGQAEDTVGNHASSHRQEFVTLVKKAAALAAPKAQLAR